MVQGGSHSRRRLLLALAAAFAVLPATGCGGGKNYEPSRVAACLRGKNFLVSSTDADFIAQANRGFYVHISADVADLGLNSAANISFGDLGKLRDAYARFPGGAREDTRGNALIVWDHFEPTSGKILLSCFK